MKRMFFLFIPLLLVVFACQSNSFQDGSSYKEPIGVEEQEHSYSSDIGKNKDAISNNNLEEELPEGVLIRVYKKNRVLKLYEDGQLIKEFSVALGHSPEGTKRIQGDKKTPEGKYYICTRNDKSRYTLFLGLSYPNILDAKKGLDNGYITQGEFDQIKNAIENKKSPSWSTSLGGAVGIHGGGISSDWTLGCISLTDKDIKTLWKYAKLKTPVEIYQ